MSTMQPPAFSCQHWDAVDFSMEKLEAVIAAAPPSAPPEVQDRWAQELLAEHLNSDPGDPCFDDDGYEEASTPTMAQLYAQLAVADKRAALLELRRTELLARLVQTQARADLTRDLPSDEEPSPAQRAAAVEAARATVVDSAVAACGGRRGPWLGRAEFAAAPAPMAGLLRQAVDRGVVTFDQACALVRDTADLGLPTDQRVALVTAVVRYAAGARQRTGAPVGQDGFRAKLRREIIKRAGTTQRRKAAADRRRVWLNSDDDGCATLGINGADARCLAALSRVDAIARAVRADGDPRTLDQLRSDAALDLLIFGQPATDAPTCVDAPGDGGWPAAQVHIVVSAASLLGANDEPGLVDGTPVAAHTIRNMAYARGSTWRRIVAEPITGYAMEATVDSYQPPAQMARVVRARDGRCRAPGCERAPVTTDIDHVKERRDGGQTRADNLQCLCRRHHSKKTRRHWGARLDEHGVVTWQLPDGTRTRTYPMDYRELGIDQVEPARTSDDARITGEAVAPVAPGAAGASATEITGPSQPTGPVQPTDPAATTDVRDGVSPGAPIDPAGTTQPTTTTGPTATGQPTTTTEPTATGPTAHPDFSCSDLSYPDSDSLTVWRSADSTRLHGENRRLREQLAAERAAHRGLRREHEAYRGEHPPF